MAISVITYLELVVGCRNKREQREAQKLPTRFNLLHINDFISAQAKELVEKYFLSHGLLIPDALIAATALPTLHRWKAKSTELIKTQASDSCMPFCLTGGLVENMSKDSLN